MILLTKSFDGGKNITWLKAIHLDTSKFSKKIKTVAITLILFINGGIIQSGNLIMNQAKF